MQIKKDVDNAKMSDKNSAIILALQDNDIMIKPEGYSMY